MKIIYNKYIPFGRYKAINLLGIVFVRRKRGHLTRCEVNHEAIHSAQMIELLIVFFYLIYLIEWFIRLLQYRDLYRSYRNISFEREAYANQDNLSYLKSRKLWVGFHYLRFKE